MSEETMKAAKSFLAAWGPDNPQQRQGFITDLAWLIQVVGRELIVNALRRAE